MKLDTRGARIAITLAWWLIIGISICNAGDERPYAERQGTKITLKPSEASFDIPQLWVGRRDREDIDNFSLSRADLEQVEKVSKVQWPGNYSMIVDATLPFKNCAAQIGVDRWGRDSSFCPLTIRAYLGRWSPGEIEGRLRKAGLKEAQNIVRSELSAPHPSSESKFIGQTPVLEKVSIGPWARYRVKFAWWYVDEGGSANVDFYFRKFKKISVIVVFMHCSESDDVSLIPSVLQSFTTPEVEHLPAG